MDNAIIIQQIKDAIQNASAIGIAVGKNHTLDDMAAALSLYLSLQQAQKQVSVASPAEPLVEVSNLVGIDKVKTRFEGTGGDLVVSFPYNENPGGEGDIQKVSYTIEGGYLNIVVKAGSGGLSFTEKDVKYTRGGGGAPKLLFIIGSPRISDLGSLFDAELLKDTTVVNIDNKRENQGFGDIVFVSGQYSSVSEQVGYLLSNIQLAIDVDIAQNLLLGISFATDNFQKPNTSYIAFDMASFLMQKGAQRSKRAYDPRPIDEARDFGQTMQPMSQQNNPFMNSYGVSRSAQRQQPPQPIQPSQPQPSAPRPIQSNPQPKEFPKPTEQKGKTPPPDWLVPKVYRGSSEN